MDTANNLLNAINNISLEDEEEGGLDLISEEALGNEQLISTFDAKLCVVARFLSDGHVDFPAMQQTLAALWKPGMGVYIKDMEPNLFLFQFYHEVDVRRVMEGCPWSFNRRALLMRRLKEGENPRSVELNTMDLWVQVYDLKVGCMSEKILTEVGNNIGKFVSSCPTNFHEVWREYLRVRVTIDVTKPLKRRMKIKKAADDWYWINFKYENVPTFCFICGLLGHSEKFCGRLFVTPEADIVKPYGSWLRAPFRKQVKPIGEKWLRNGLNSGGRNSEFQPQFGGGSSSQDPHVSPPNQQSVGKGENPGDKAFQINQMGGNGEIRNTHNNNAIISPTNQRTDAIIIENKKRRTNSELDQDSQMGLGNKVLLDTDGDENMNVETSPNTVQNQKNGPEASILRDARLSQ